MRRKTGAWVNCAGQMKTGPKPRLNASGYEPLPPFRFASQRQNERKSSGRDTTFLLLTPGLLSEPRCGYQTAEIVAHQFPQDECYLPALSN